MWKSVGFRTHMPESGLPGTGPWASLYPLSHVFLLCESRLSVQQGCWEDQQLHVRLLAQSLENGSCSRTWRFMFETHPGFCHRACVQLLTSWLKFQHIYWQTLVQISSVRYLYTTLTLLNSIFSIPKSLGCIFPSVLIFQIQMWD